MGLRAVGLILMTVEKSFRRIGVDNQIANQIIKAAPKHLFTQVLVIFRPVFPAVTLQILILAPGFNLSMMYRLRNCDTYRLSDLEVDH
jgi:hypothetical protein